MVPNARELAARRRPETPPLWQWGEAGDLRTVC